MAQRLVGGGLRDLPKPREEAEKCREFLLNFQVNSEPKYYMQLVSRTKNLTNQNQGEVS
jgi:hypothetical protein